MPTFPNLIAEIGGNHEGDFDYAQRLVDLAIESAADTIKLQLYTGDSIANPLVDPERNAHFKRFELAPDQHIEIAKKIRRAGKEYLASVWNIDMLVWIDPFLDRYKVGSGDLTNKSMLREFALRGKPIILSTGLSNMDEVVRSIEFIRQTNKAYEKPNMLSVLQCTSMYPIDFSDANLAVIKSLMEISGITVGYSDHTVGSDALFASVIMGAKVLEFHFTDTRENKTFRDHAVSLTCDEVNALAKQIRNWMELYGEARKLPLAIEIGAGHLVSFRRAAYPARDIEKGEVIAAEDLVCLRPNKGICAWDIDTIIGATAKVALTKHQPIHVDMFDIRQER